MADETILVIDDDENDLVLLSRLLDRAGYGVITASNGAEGLERVRENEPDLVMVDYRMPGMDGYEVSRRLKDDEGTRNIPVLILTGADSSKETVAGLDAGADDFVGKSADVEVILARLRALLRVKSHQDRIVEQAEQLRQKSDEIMALNQRFNRDLRFARKVQEALLPPRSFRTSRVEIQSSYYPSETLSGDFYDYFEIDGKTLIFVADVSGHGLPAAILTSLLKSYFHSETTLNTSPAEFMAELNDFLCSASLPSQFATGVFLELTDDRIRFATAAHPPFLLRRSATSRTETIERPGNMLGTFEQAAFENATVEIESGDVIFAYTDGLTDRISVEGEFYSTERIERILESSESEELEAIHDRIIEDIQSFSQTEELSDDVAFVLVRVRE
ncbi:MAG: fused response regulator/phosphatase [Thermoanaerobaculia bacterium]|nr:fused response regulator/phosphatase [Thermoanaerobaculia bacterium]